MGNGFWNTKVDPGLGGFGCNSDTECWNGWLDASGYVARASSIAEQQ